MAVNGFGILCTHGPEGERFTVGAADPMRLAALIESGIQPGVSMTEAELRTELLRAGFSAGDVHRAMHLARQWATTITRKPGPKSTVV